MRKEPFSTRYTKPFPTNLEMGTRVITMTDLGPHVLVLTRDGWEIESLYCLKKQTIG